MTGCSSAAAAATTSFGNLLSSSSATRRPPNFLCTASETQTGVLRFIGCNAGDFASSYRSFSPLVCVPRNLVRSLPSSLTQSSQVELEPQIEDRRPHLTDEDNLRTVGIKIQLRKQCKFGEQFFIVGAQPDLGLWNPLDALPMTWSDDHLWTAELVMPLGEPVQFKFILREITGKFLWQPGKDRVLHTWETSNIISVIEDWEDVEAQQVNEEPAVNNVCEECDLMESTAEICGNQVVDENIASDIAKNEDAISVKVELDTCNTIGDIEDETVKEQEKGQWELEKANGRLSSFNAEHSDSKVDNDEDAYCRPDHVLEPVFSERQDNIESDLWRDEIKWGQATLKRFLNNFGFI